MPDIRNCKRCGKIFNYIGGMPICPNCKDKDEEDFKRIKEYLYNNPGAPMSEVATVLDVSIEKIKKFLREGRLEIVGDDANFVLDCEGCGKSIKTGRYCNECEYELKKGLKDTANDLKRAAFSNNSRSNAGGIKFLSKDEHKHNPNK